MTVALAALSSPGARRQGVARVPRPPAASRRPLPDSGPSPGAGRGSDSGSIRSVAAADGTTVHAFDRAIATTHGELFGYLCGGVTERLIDTPTRPVDCEGCLAAIEARS